MDPRNLASNVIFLTTVLSFFFLKEGLKHLDLGLMGLEDKIHKDPKGILERWQMDCMSMV